MTKLLSAIIGISLLFILLMVYFHLTIGLDAGPVATWVSGLASTSAVMVALWGQHQSHRLRVYDKANLDIDNAHQVNIKLNEFVKIMGAFHEGLRVGVVMDMIKLKDDREGVFMIAPVVGFVDIPRPTLSPSEELLFAKSGNLEALHKIRYLDSSIRVLQSMVLKYNSTAEQLYGKEILTGIDGNGVKTNGFDRKDINLSISISVMSGKIYSIMKYTSDTLGDVLKHVPEASRVVMQFMPEHERFDLDISRAATEYNAGMPQWSFNASAARAQALLPKGQESKVHKVVAVGLLVSAVVDTARRW